MNLRRFQTKEPETREVSVSVKPDSVSRLADAALERELLEVNAYIKELADLLVPMHNRGEVFIPLHLRERLLEVRRRVRHQ